MKPPPPALCYPLAVILLGLGGYMLMRRYGPNHWIGVRVPWTLADREIWDKSWTLAAVILVMMGLGLLLSFLFFLLSTLVLLILCILYPLFLYRQKYGTIRYWKDIGWLDYRPAVKCPQCGHLQKLENERQLPGAHCEACGVSLAR
ncbi:MAG: SdpI family protein [Desulfobaccales bacterium]